MRLFKLFLASYRHYDMKSQAFSRNTLENLNNAPFSELDAAEKRLSGWEHHQNYLRANMTDDERAALAWIESNKAALLAAHERTVLS